MRILFIHGRRQQQLNFPVFVNEVVIRGAESIVEEPRVCRVLRRVEIDLLVTWLGLANLGGALELRRWLMLCWLSVIYVLQI